MNTKSRSTHSISDAFTFLLIGSFAVFSMVIVVLGVRAYRNTEQKTSAHNEYRILSSYVRSMVRAADGNARFRAEIVDGQRVLTMEEDYDGDRYLTRLYCYDGKLREWFSDAQNPFDPKDGEEICSAKSFTAEVTEGFLTVRMQSGSGERIDIRIALYSET